MAYISKEHCVVCKAVVDHCDNECITCRNKKAEAKTIKLNAMSLENRVARLEAIIDDICRDGTTRFDN